MEILACMIVFGVIVAVWYMCCQNQPDPVIDKEGEEKREPETIVPIKPGVPTKPVVIVSHHGSGRSRGIEKSTGPDQVTIYEYRRSARTRHCRYCDGELEMSAVTCGICGRRTAD